MVFIIVISHRSGIYLAILIALPSSSYLLAVSYKQARITMGLISYPEPERVEGFIAIVVSSLGAPFTDDRIGGSICIVLLTGQGGLRLGRHGDYLGLPDRRTISSGRVIVFWLGDS